MINYKKILIKIFAYLLLIAIFVLFYNYSNEFAADGNKKIEKITLVGRKNIDKNVFAEKLLGYKGMPINGVDLNEIKKQVEKIKIVDQAYVKRMLPNEIIVEIIEKEPVLIYIKDNKKFLVDINGTIIREYIPKQDKKFKSLKLIRGDKLKHMIESFLNIINVENGLEEYVVVGYFVDNIRWDILLNDGKIIKLPVKGYLNAWENIGKLKDDPFIFDKNVKIIDARVNGKIIVGN